MISSVETGGRYNTSGFRRKASINSSESPHTDEHFPALKIPPAINDDAKKIYREIKTVSARTTRWSGEPPFRISNNTAKVWGEALGVTDKTVKSLYAEAVGNGVVRPPHFVQTGKYTGAFGIQPKEAEGFLAVAFVLVAEIKEQLKSAGVEESVPFPFTVDFGWGYIARETRQLFNGREVVDNVTLPSKTNNLINTPIQFRPPKTFNHEIYDRTT